MYAHLGHPLVNASARLLRAAVWSGHVGLHRVAAVVSDDPELEHVLVGAYSRFVLVGADGIRLHEEVLYAGGWLPETGRFRRIENLTVLGGLLDRALTTGTPAAPVIWPAAGWWPRARDPLLAAIDRRTDDRIASLRAKLAARKDDERRRIVTGAERFAASLRKALADSEAEEGALFSMAEARGDEREIAQYRRDRQSWRERLDQVEDRRDREIERVAARYRDVRPHSFPVAVIFAVPRREATR